MENIHWNAFLDLDQSLPFSQTMPTDTDTSTILQKVLKNLQEKVCKMLKIGNDFRGGEGGLWNTQMTSIQSINHNWLFIFQINRLN